MQQLIILRGLPGAGKSSFARKLREEGGHGWHVVSADDFFIVDGEYQFRKELLHYAHEYCRSQVVKLLMNGKSVIVDNTNTTIWEIKQYLDLTALFKLDIIVSEINGNYGSIHNVPEEAVNRMRNRWEELTPELLNMYNVSIQKVGLNEN